MKHFRLFLTVILGFLMFFAVGCSKGENAIATISANTDSEYMHTFKDLSLGILYDFDVKLLKADRSWITLWVEGYQDGKKVKPYLAELSFGLFPEQEKNGHLGVGIVNPNKDKPSILMYGPGVSSGPDSLKSNILISDADSTWNYAIGDDEVSLKSGETKILGVYRKGENGFRTYDPQDEMGVKRMIAEDEVVLLIKVKVEKRNKR